MWYIGHLHYYYRLLTGCSGTGSIEGLFLDNKEPRAIFLHEEFL
jgi:hypothetical protein